MMVVESVVKHVDPKWKGVQLGWDLVTVGYSLPEYESQHYHTQTIQWAPVASYESIVIFLHLYLIKTFSLFFVCIIFFIDI